MLRENWHNGGRLLLLMAGFAVCSLLFAGAVWLTALVWPGQGESELELFAPLSLSDVIINSRVEGVDGPATHAGEHYNGTLTICNDDDKVQTITFVIQFERLFGPVHFEPADLGGSGNTVDFPVEPGCHPLTGDSAPLPEQVTPGLWRESSSAIVRQGRQQQTVPFVSEPFEVLP